MATKADRRAAITAALREYWKEQNREALLRAHRAALARGKASA